MKSPEQLLKDNLIVKHRAGSHAYGTALPTSDEDYRGIFCAEPVNLLTPFFPVREVTDIEEEDTKFYELAHFMKLCLDCNPNIIETLHIDLSDILYAHPAYNKLRKHRYDFLSSKIAFTTTGYATAQIKRIKGHNKWISNPQPKEAPQQKDFVSLVQWFGEEKVMPRDFTMPRVWKDYFLAPYGGDIFGVYNGKGRQTYNYGDGALKTQYDDERHELDTPICIIKFNRAEWNQAKDNWKNYWTWKENRNDVRNELEEKYGYDCYSDDTDFLTKDGWKSFDEITENDLLATFKPKSHNIEYQKYIERFDGTFTGNLYNFIGQHIDTLVTPNHRMYINSFSRNLEKYHDDWNFVEAAKVPDSFDILRTISPKKNRQKLPSEFNENILNHVSMMDYLRIMGWFISDGSCQFRDGKLRCITISQSKPQSRLTQTLNKQRNYGKIQCNEYVYNRVNRENPERTWRFNREISELIYSDCGHGSKNKRIPNWVFELTAREMGILLKSLLQGDGTQRNHQDETFVYYTSNKGLADDVQRLAFLCGFESSKWGPYNYEYDQDDKWNDNKMYQIFINKKIDQFKRRNRSSPGCLNVVPVENQRIVCFMTSNGTLVTRRNGKIGLHGNSKHGMHCVRLMRMGLEALRDGEIIVKRPDAQELLAIRHGAWSYEEMVKYAEYMDNEIRHVWYKKTELPKKPDIKNAAKILMEVQELMWNE